MIKVKDTKYRQGIMKKIAKTDIRDINDMGFKKVKETFFGSKR
jgi:hypothetical protein